jgi:MFS family permease
MGFFLQPMVGVNGWDREAFALALALQNLMWGLGQPLAGLLADKFGTWRTLTTGAVLYALGLVAMAYTTDPLMLQFTAGVLLGLGIAGSAFFLVLAAFARMLPEHMRGTAFGLGTAAGSVGQLVFAPLGQAFIEAYDFQIALMFLAACVITVPLLGIVIRGKPVAAPTSGHRDQTISEALAEAFGHRSFLLLVAGFFVCGYHVAFITVHLPAYVVDLGLQPSLGAWAIGLIGAFNIFGALLSGRLMGQLPKRYILSFIYFGRAVVITLFIFAPVGPASILIFSAAMGLLWLSTIPPTQGLVAVMFGTRYLAMLFGFVFLSHQVGSFLGVWLGGKIYDATGSYDLMWWSSVAAGVAAAIVHWPIVERRAPALAGAT